MAKTKASTAKTAAARKSAKTMRRATTRKGTAGKNATKARASKKTTGQANKKAAAKKSSRGTPASKKPKPNKTVPVDRRIAADRRTSDDRRSKQQKPVAIEHRKLERRAKVSRRRQIDPTTCERDYTSEELDFMSALDEYKRTSGRMFPTCSEILEVIRGLGYQKTLSVEENGPSPAATKQAGISLEGIAETFPSSVLDEQVAGAPLASTLKC